MEKVKLNNDLLMPILGFGVFQIPDPKVCEESVAEALRVGYRLIDTAAVYGNEEAVGRAVKRSGIPRGEVFLTSKLWIRDQGYEPARKAFGETLRRLGTDYLDLYLIHQPFGDYYGSWRAMEELYEEGRIRAIGVSNFTPDRVMDLMLHNRIAPAVDQIETHPFNQQIAVQSFLEDNAIRMESWGPFAEGKNGLFSDGLLQSVAEKYHKSVAQVVLRWLIQRGVVAIPKSVHADRIAENFDVFDFSLSDGDMDAIRGLDTGKSLFLDHRDPETVKRLSGMGR